MKKIVFISPLPLYNNEAPSIHALEISSAFQKLGSDVLMFAPSISRLEYLPTFRIKYVFCTKKFISLLYQPLLAIALTKELLLGRIDIVYFRISPFLILPIFIGKVFNKTIVAEVNGVQSEEIELLGNRLLRLIAKTKLFNMTEMLSLRLSSKIICVTDGIKEYVVTNYNIKPDKVHVVHNGVDTDKFKPEKINNHNVLIPNYQSNTLYYGYVGGLMKWQGIEFIIQAFDKLPKDISRELIIVGDGPNKDFLIDLCKSLNLKSSVKFLGQLDHCDVPQFLSQIDICLSYPTKIRSGVTSPFKIYEYLAAGKCTIVSDIQGVGDRFSEVTVVAKAEDVEDLKDKMQLVEDSEEYRLNMGLNARKYVEKEHSWKAVGRKILDIISQ